MVDAYIVMGLLAVALVLFISERVSFDVAALIIMCTLMLTGVLSPREGLSGFANEATLTIGSMFVLSEGIRRTGALEVLARWFSRIGAGSDRTSILAIMVVVGTISAFINNTAAVAMFIPVALAVASDLRISPSKLLMPMSFAAMFGGVCTLIGTSTNILVSSLARDHGMPGFSMFEFAPLGLLLLALGFAYLLAIGIRLIPKRRRDADLAETFQLNEYLTEIVLEPGSAQVGKTLESARLTTDLDLDVVQILDEESGATRNPDQPLQAGDILRIRGSVREIEKLRQRGRDSLVEAVIAPGSALEGQSIRSIDFDQRMGAVLLALRHHGRLRQERMDDLRLSGGDSVLLSIDESRIPEVERDPSFVVVSEVPTPRYRRSRMPVAVAILVAVVVSASLGFLPIVVAALTGSLLLIMTGCLRAEEAYTAVNWKIIMLLAGVLPLGLAMEKTGVATMAAKGMLALVGELGPTAILSGFFFLAMMLTNVISNQATAALLVPVVIQTADTLDIAARPLLVAVTVAASLSFMTPVGYQTNTLIYGPGQYEFKDFLKVGTPLNLILWIAATLLIPVFWPFS